MEAIDVLTDPKKKTGNAALLPIKMAAKKNQESISFSADISIIPKSVKKPYYKFYKVFKDDTSVTEVLVNDFKPFKPTLLKIKAACLLNSIGCPAFFLPDNDLMFHGLLSCIRAMNYAKAGALKYISRLINEGEKSYDLLLKYREAHYEGLNINLTDKNIRKLEERL